MEIEDRNIDGIINAIKEKNQILDLFMKQVVNFFETHPDIVGATPPIVHSVKSRRKSENNIRDKIQRYRERGKDVRKDNVLQEITDIVGVRVLHLHQQQWEDIHRAIKNHVDAGEWVFAEEPKAYSWDPDASEFFKRNDVAVNIKESHYTSVHYLVRPRVDAPACCEIQVRTLFEEVWGEIDHAVNYPYPTGNIAIQEQLRVLAKLVATGTRLADAVFKIQQREM